MAKQPTHSFPRASRSLTITFGMVGIQVGIAPLMGERGIKGSMLCPDHLTNLKQRWLCEHGDHYVAHSDRVTGYEHGGQYVVLTEGDLKALEAVRDGAIRMTAYVNASDVDPAYVDKTYLIWPKPGFEQQYDLLHHGLLNSGRALVGTCVMGKTTQTFVIRYSDEFGCLVAAVCNFAADVRDHDVEKVTSYVAARPEPDTEALELAEALFASLDTEFDPEAVTDSYTEALEAAIIARAQGEGIEIPETPDAGAMADDFMAVLKAQVEENAKAREGVTA